MTRTTSARLARLTLAAAVAAVTLPAVAAGGTVQGKVEASPLKYLEDTVVYVKEVKGAFAPRAVSLDQRNMRFVPHLAVITVGDTVKFQNHDNVGHNVYSPDGEGYELGTFNQDEERTHTFSRPGAYAQLCRIHPEMLGYVFVGQNPYAAAVDRKGAYRIDDVPPGTYELAVWNAKLTAPAQRVTVTDGGTVVQDFALHR
ncbi:MAG: plastocyanin/azurin family copper-binding protein [Anaeromyxobacteraceae bacterium]